MKQHFFTGAFGLGALVILWVGAGFVGSNLLALMMTVIIGAVYVAGTLELRQFRQASATLAAALAVIPDKLESLDEWLGGVHPSLQNAVRLRIEGERMGLPGPALTPYLVGLLVMLGMLGTFLGMVVTLNGAAFSLEGSADLQAIRAALAAPIKGLGLAFGTSVAGVASSAMLGLMSAVSRRERMQAAHWLDTKIATALRGFSLAHQRQETYKALQFQAQAMPEVVDQLQAMMAQMERLSLQLNERLISNQDHFHREVKGIYRDLAASVDQSLKDSLRQSAHVAGESIKPVIEVAMTRMAQEANRLHERVVQTAQTQLDGLATRLDTTTTTVTETWTAALANHERTSVSMVQGMAQSFTTLVGQFEQGSHTLMTAVNDAQTQMLAKQALNEQRHQEAMAQSLGAMAATLQHEWQQAGAQTLAQQQQICATLTQTAQDITQQAHTSANTTLGEITRLMACAQDLIHARIESESAETQQHHERMAQLASLLRSELGTLRDEEAQRGQAAVARLGELQAALAHHLTTLGTALEDPIRQLIETASEAPRAAADVIGQLRQEMSSSIVRDNALLEERSRIMATLSTLLDAINHAAAEQRSVIDALVSTSAATLDQAGHRFAEQVSTETSKLSDIAAHVTCSAVEVSSLSEAFGFAVQSFNDANEKLITNLQRIEGAMDKSMTRSDEQLAYYVAQAREIIDLSIMSQKEIMKELRQLPSQPARSGEEVI